MTRNTKSAISLPADNAVAEHDAWFREEVQKTVRGLADGSVTLTPEEEHDLRWQDKRTELLIASRKPE